MSVQKVEKMSVGEAPHLLGAHYTTKLTRIANRIEPYEGKRRKVSLTDKHLPTVKRGIKAGRQQLAESTRTAAIHPPITEDLLRGMNGEWVTGPQPIRKGFTMWEGIRSEVSKMGPDQSEVHIVGSSNKKRGTLRRIPAPTTGM